MKVSKKMPGVSGTENSSSSLFWNYGNEEKYNTTNNTSLKKELDIWHAKIPNAKFVLKEQPIFECKQDATMVYKPIITEKFEKCEQSLSGKIQETPKVKNGMTDYLTEFNNYKPKDTQKYNKVLQYVKSNLQKTDTKRAVPIANMVCSLSEKYGIDPEITAAILDHETGGFNFSEASMNPSKKKYKGVMQVDKTTIECMYADGNAWKKLKSGSLEAIHSYDHRHYIADEKRISELKKEYPTPESLHKAIAEDVVLGLEVGIIAYKGKLSRKKGNTRLALSEYCGNQYKLPNNSSVPTKIYPIPRYNQDA